MSDSSKRCRLCGNVMGSSPVISLFPMPKAAQYYPETIEFNDDQGVLLEVYQCSYCELLQLCGEPVSYFKEVITAATLSADARAARFNELSMFVDQFELHGKSVIEVGSGKGGVIDILADAGVVSVGLEYSVESVRYAQTLGRNMMQGYLEELHDSYIGKYDAFVSFNYIEHQPRTKYFILALYNILSDEGVGYITAPNVDYLLDTCSLYEFVADHLVYFSARTMRRAFEFNGFDVISSKVINNENDVALVVKKRKNRLISGMSSVESLVVCLQELVDGLVKQGKRVAVWGAGHRTLALLSIASLSGIEFVVDSAEFKHGKYTPVTHKLIVSPEVLEKSDIDTVIVMVPGLYPDEVIKKIRGFDRPINIYKLQDNQLVVCL